MSIRLPDTNIGASANRVSLTVPAAVNAKPAATGYTTAFWFRTPKAASFSTQDPVLLFKAKVNASGGVGRIVVNDTFTALTATFRSNDGTSTIYTDTATIEPDKVYMGMLIVNPTNHHLVVCEVGGTPDVHTVATTALYDLAMTTNKTWSNFCGSGNESACYFPMENVVMWQGTFPETSNVPDTTLIGNIANGVQALSGVAALMTGGVNKFHFPMANDLDLTDAFGGVEALTPTNISADAGLALYPCGPLRPVALRPALTENCISQCVFGTRGDSATATTTIKIEGGAYAGLPTLSKVQCRIVNEIGRTVVSDWSDLSTTAPSGGAGTWTGKSITSIPMQAGYLYVEFRGVNSGGTVIAGPVSGYGLRGAGFHMIGQAQSQLHQLVVNGGNLAVSSGMRACTAMQKGNAFVPGDPEIGEPDKPAAPYITENWMVSSGADLSHGMRHGIRTMFNEINALFPGVPMQFSTVSLGGTSLRDYSDFAVPGTPGLLAPRWAALRDNFGVVQPYYQLFLGHSSGTGNTYGMLEAVVAWSQANLGTPIKYLHAPVPRYKGAGTDETSGNAKSVADSRNGARQYCIDNPGANVWLGSWSTVFTSLSAGVETGGSDPHSDLQSPFGQGRTGGLLGLGLLRACGAVEDEPIGIVSATAVGATSVRLNFGRVNSVAL